jgi:hypothetical protein
MEPPFRIRGGVTWYRFRILPRRQATPSYYVRSAHKPLSPWEFRRTGGGTDLRGEIRRSALSFTVMFSNYFAQNTRVIPALRPPVKQR